MPPDTHLQQKQVSHNIQLYIFSLIFTQLGNSKILTLPSLKTTSMSQQFQRTMPTTQMVLLSRKSSLNVRN
ncbi:hypothetical protein FGO68_gene10407 [Halteria grandinella]|uniref:Uncharacterized protein n=1 Tax=Halteria grandinella TaxID=5974 RepID=A0A8J8NUF7_HALGN|nr:hypothetical protein FGO68_gene10407 [Halteria grandinella]